MTEDATTCPRCGDFSTGGLCEGCARQAEDATTDWAERLLAGIKSNFARSEHDRTFGPAKCRDACLALIRDRIMPSEAEDATTPPTRVKKYKLSQLGAVDGDTEICLVRDMEDLAADYDALAAERDALSADYATLLKESNAFEAERDQLQAERDQLQAENRELTRAVQGNALAASQALAEKANLYTLAQNLQKQLLEWQALAVKYRDELDVIHAK